jgi:peptidyl-prolyl cis-trans isomerase D
MMQAIRTRAGSIVVKGLFVLLIVSFGFWGIYTRSPFYQSHSPDTVVATVGDQEIRAADLQRELQPTLERLRAQFGGTVDPQQIKQLGIADAVLDRLINRLLLEQEAQHLGLDVTDAVIRSAIYDNPAFRDPEGKFDRQRFEAALTMNHLTEDELVGRLRHDIPRADLLQSLTAGVASPQPVVDVLYRYRNEKRVADIVAFPVATIGDVGQPSQGDLEKFYEVHKEIFRAPEYRTLTVASLSPSDLKQTAPIPEDVLHKAYDEHKDELATPEQREIQQVLAPSEEKAKEAEAALRAGKDWTEVAKGLGQDADTVDLGLLSRKEIPHELGDVAFELPVNQPSQPVKSPLGWHILRVVKIVPAAAPSFDAAKAKLEESLKMQAAVDRLDKLGNQADDALGGGATLAEVAAKFGFKTTTIAAVDQNGNDASGKKVSLPIAADEILKTAFDTNQGDTSRITDTNDGALFAVRVDKVMPPAVRALAEVKDAAVAAWQADQKREVAKKDAEALAAMVSPAETLAKAAGAKRLTLSAAVTLSRTPQRGAAVPPALVAKLFAAKPGEVATVDDAAGAYTAQLKQIESPETVPAVAAKGLSDQLADAARLDIAGEFTEGLRRRFPVEIKRDALNHMF